MTSILWLTHRDPLNTHAGGAEESMRQITSGLVNRGHEVSILSPRYSGQSDQAILDGVRILRVGSVVSNHLLVPRLVTRSLRPDFVVVDLAHVIPWLTSFYASARTVAFFRHYHARTLPGQVPVVGQILLRSVEQAYPLIFRRDPFVVPSESARHDLIQLGVRPDHTVLIPYGVNKDLFVPGEQDRIPRIIHFAGLRPYKRVDHAVRAFKHVIDRGTEARMIIVGEGPVKPALIRLAQDLGLSGKIEFPGRVSRQALAALVGRSTVHVQTSTSEGWGLTVTEAAACGVPTAAYDVPGLSDAVREGPRGILVESGNIESLGDAIIRLIEDRAKWAYTLVRDSKLRTWLSVSNDWDALFSSNLRATPRGLETGAVPPAT